MHPVLIDAIISLCTWAGDLLPTGVWPAAALNAWLRLLDERARFEVAWWDGMKGIFESHNWVSVTLRWRLVHDGLLSASGDDRAVGAGR